MEQHITVCPDLDEIDLHCLHVFMDNDAGEILAYARCFSEKPGSAQEQVVGFYEKLGFSVESGPYDECGIRHYGMKLN